MPVAVALTDDLKGTSYLNLSTSVARLLKAGGYHWPSAAVIPRNLRGRFLVSE